MIRTFLMFRNTPRESNQNSSKTRIKKSAAYFFLRNFRKSNRHNHETFTALPDVTCQVSCHKT